MKNRVMSFDLPESEKISHRFTKMNTDFVPTASVGRVICVNLWQKNSRPFTSAPFLWRATSPCDYEIIPVNKFIVIHVAEHRFDLR